MSELEQELEMILSEELGLKDPTFSDLVTSPPQLVKQKEDFNMHLVEKSFKELMTDIQSFADIHVRDIIIETLKNITHQSFGDKNIFESSLVNFKERVKYKYESFPNQLTEEQFDEMTDFRRIYSEFISGFSIPLVSPKWSVGSCARLVIAIPNDLPIPQISVQFYVDNVDKWVSVPCRTNTVKETIMNLFPQE